MFYRHFTRRISYQCDESAIRGPLVLALEVCVSFLEVVYTIIGACYIGKLFEFPVIHTLDLCAGGEEFDRAFRV